MAPTNPPERRQEKEMIAEIYQYLQIRRERPGWAPMTSAELQGLDRKNCGGELRFGKQSPSRSATPPLFMSHFDPAAAAAHRNLITLATDMGVFDLDNSYPLSESVNVPGPSGSDEEMGETEDEEMGDAEEEETEEVEEIPGDYEDEEAESIADQDSDRTPSDATSTGTAVDATYSPEQFGHNDHDDSVGFVREVFFQWFDVQERGVDVVPAALFEDRSADENTGSRSPGDYDNPSESSEFTSPAVRKDKGKGRATPPPAYEDAYGAGEESGTYKGFMEARRDWPKAKGILLGLCDSLHGKAAEEDGTKLIVDQTMQMLGVIRGKYGPHVEKIAERQISKKAERK